MNKLKITFLALVMATSMATMAQSETSTMSLQQAVDYALKNNPSLKNADIDI